MHSNGHGLRPRITQAARRTSTYVLQRLGVITELVGVVCVAIGAFLIAPAMGFIVTGILLLLFSLAISLNGRTNAGTIATNEE